MAKKAKKKKSASRAKRPAAKNTSMRKTKKAAKKSYRAAHARAGLTYKKAKKKKKAPSRPNPTRALESKISSMKPGVFYDTTLSGANVRMKRVGKQLVILPKAKRK